MRVNGPLGYNYAISQRKMSMKRILISTLFIAFAAGIMAQDSWDNLVTWEANYDKDQAAINITAHIENDWVIYSQFTDPEGPIPLEFEFEAAAGVEYIDGVEELTDPITKMSEMFGVEVMKFKETASFKQKIKLSSDSAIIRGNVTFMACDSEKCLPPKTIPFQVKI